MKVLQSNERPALSSLLILLGLVLIGMVVGSILQILVMLPLTGVNNLSKILTNPEDVPNAWLALILGQGLASFVLFIGVGWLYWQVIERKPMSALNFKQLPKAYIFLFVVIIQVCFLPFNSWLQTINSEMKLPKSMAGLEEFMKNMESQMGELTGMMTNFSSIWQLFLAILVIGIIAGVGEELIFRGLVQRKLWLGTGNIHIAIWGAAFIFSFIHFQFYGFLPRMLLGALLGYLYFWTGNLWVSIFAHAFNNSFAVVMIYLENHEIISPDLEKMENVPFQAVIISLVLTLVLLFYFRKLVEQV